MTELLPVKSPEAPVTARLAPRGTLWQLLQSIGAPTVGGTRFEIASLPGLELQAIARRISAADYVFITSFFIERQMNASPWCMMVAKQSLRNGKEPRFGHILYRMAIK